MLGGGEGEVNDGVCLPCVASVCDAVWRQGGVEDEEIGLRENERGEQAACGIGRAAAPVDVMCVGVTDKEKRQLTLLERAEGFE